MESIHPSCFRQLKEKICQFAFDLLGILNADHFLYSAFSAFPDSFQFDQGSQNHSFRIREELKDLANGRRPLSVDGFIYGFAHFTQRRDSTSKRGYSQVWPYSSA